MSRNWHDLTLWVVEYTDWGSQCISYIEMDPLVLHLLYLCLLTSRLVKFDTSLGIYRFAVCSVKFYRNKGPTGGNCDVTLSAFRCLGVSGTTSHYAKELSLREPQLYHRVAYLALSAGKPRYFPRNPV